MSGQPLKTQSDVNKFRNEYMETLKLQEKLNDMNLQANKTYLLTGQLPPQSQLQDTRTTAEKLADVEKMKQEIASNLKDIAEPTFAYQIVNKVIESPLNVNNSLLRFLAQRAPSIAFELKKSYSYGIIGDNNDLDIIVNFIKNMYSEQQGKLQSTKSYLNSVGSQGSYSKVLSGNDIDNIILGFEDIIKNLSIISQKNANLGGIRGSGKLTQNIRRILQDLKDVLPTSEEIKLLLQDVEQVEYNNPYQYPNVELEPNLKQIEPYRRVDLEAFYNLIEKLPKYSEIMALINKIKQYIQSGDYNLVIQGLNNIQNMFANIPLKLNDPIIETFRKIKERQQYKINQAQKLESSQTRQFIENQSKQARDISKANKVYVINPETNPVNINQVNPQNIKGEVDVNIPQGAVNQLAGIQLANNQSNQNNNQLINDNQNNNQLLNISSQIISGLNEFETDDVINIIRINYPNEGHNFNLNDNLKDKKIKLKAIINHLKQIGEYQPESLIHGLGLKKTRGRPRGRGIVKPVLNKIPNFTGFGINEINQKQLNNGIVKIRRNTKTNYMDMPSKRVSSSLQNILKTIVGGGVPKYNEFSNLDDEERHYLEKLISRSNLTDRISVPAPSKDNQEKDIHNFEVMRGQIMSGNDSKELVKTFKLLIRKLSKQGLLPKADVEDILDTLMNLNY